MALQLRNGTHSEAVDDERHLEFIAGFPCTQFSCNGTLDKTPYQGRPSITCSMCEHVYYILAP